MGCYTYPPPPPKYPPPPPPPVSIVVLSTLQPPPPASDNRRGYIDALKSINDSILVTLTLILRARFTSTFYPNASRTSCTGYVGSDVRHKKNSSIDLTARARVITVRCSLYRLAEYWPVPPSPLTECWSGESATTPPGLPSLPPPPEVRTIPMRAKHEYCASTTC